MAFANQVDCRRLGILLAWAAILFFSTFPLPAQDVNGNITGVITDSSGAPIPGAQLALKSLDTAAVSNATSDSAGGFSFPNLTQGNYELRVSSKGFRDFVQTGISVHMNSSMRIPVSLELGTASQTIEVNANASPVNFESPEVKGTISKQEIEALPLQVAGGQRSAAQFVGLLPGVSTVSAGSGNSNSFNAKFNGGQLWSDEAVLDGITMEEGLLSQSGMVAIQNDFPISPEAVGEISVLTSNYDVQYGASQAAVIIASTKEGTNTLHGGAYEFNRNNFFNARPFGSFVTPRDSENDYGGYIGGAARLPGLWSHLTKTYFFVNYEQYRSVGATTQPVLTVPTAKMRNGDFSEWPYPIYNPTTTVTNPNYNPNAPTSASNLPYSRQQFMGCNGNQPNVICPTDPLLQSSLAQQWLKYVPMPNRPGLVNNYVSPNGLASSLNANTDQWDARGDEYFGNNDHLFGTYHYRGSLPFTQAAFPPVIDTNNTRIPNYSNVTRINWDHIFSPTLVNHVAWGFLDLRTQEYNASDCCVSQVPQIAGVYSHKHEPAITFSDTYSNYGGNADLLSTRPTYVVNDTISWVKGSHTLHFGGEYRGLHYPTRAQQNGSGTFNFTSANTGLVGIPSGNAIASFLLGEVGSGSAEFFSLPEFSPYAKAYGFFAGDTWKTTSKLTLTLGLRWDVFTPSVEENNNTSFFDPTGVNPGAGGRLGSLAFAGTKWGAASYGADAPENTYYKAFGPRVGIAYALTPKTVIRTGYGIFYEQAFYPGWNGGIATDGFNENVTYNSSLGGIQPAFLLQNGFPQNFTRPPFINASFLNGQNAPNYRPVDANRRPYTQQWNFTIERQIGNNASATIAYVGNKGTRLLSQIGGINTLNPSLLSLGNVLNNQFSPGQTVLDGVHIPYQGWVQQMTGCAPTVAQALLPYPQYCGNIFGQNENLGNSTYHALQLTFAKRYSAGLYFQAAYTFSKTLTDADEAQVTQGAVYRISPFQQNRDKSLSLQDVPQVLSLSTSYQLPFGKGKQFFNASNSVLNFLVSGWELNAIFHYNSGSPLYFSSGYCNVPSQFAAACIPTVLPGANPLAQSRGSFNPDEPFLNVNSFTPANSFNFNFGDGARVSNIRGFGYTNLDFGITRYFAITERFKLQIRGEAFNALNLHSLQANFVTDVSSPSFGMWNGTVTSPRNLQLGGKITF